MTGCVFFCVLIGVCLVAARGEAIHTVFLCPDSGGDGFRMPVFF